MYHRRGYVSLTLITKEFIPRVHSPLILRILSDAQSVRSFTYSVLIWVRVPHGDVVVRSSPHQYIPCSKFLETSWTNTTSAMCRYLLIAIVTPLLLWSFWTFTPHTASTTTITATITTTDFNTLILTLTLPPTTTRTVTARDEHNFEHEKFIRENCEYHEKLEREKIVREEAERVWDAKMRASWTKWFMDYLYKPLAYLFVGYVIFGMMINWDWDHSKRCWAEAQAKVKERERKELENQVRRS
jgi:hypothetical protein